MPPEKFKLARAVAATLRAAILVMFVLPAPSYADDLPQFGDYQVPLYRGAIRPPKWIQHVGDDEWRDDLGKMVGPPEINFAGRYFVAVHSCGTGCRYYTLTDLSTGRDLDLLEMFTAAEPAPKTRDGREYITDLISRPDSRLLVAQYYIGPARKAGECRERVFLFGGGRLKPVTQTLHACRKF
jgi:hypothetical protein